MPTITEQVITTNYVNTELPTVTMIDTKELEKLKRLDENVKAQIAAYKECVDSKFGTNYSAKEQIEFLESLYK
jgi:hypothetical protein